MIKKILKPLVAAVRRRTGSLHTTRTLPAPAGPVTLYPTAEVGPDCTFGGCNFIHGGTNLVKAKVGRFTYIGEKCLIGTVTIGSFCSIAGEVIACLGTHPTGFVSTHPIFYSLKTTSRFWPEFSGALKNNLESTFPNLDERETRLREGIPVVVGNDVWIGYRAIILDGVTIGDGAIVAAGAVVAKDVEPYSIVAGVPAKHIRYRFPPGIIQELLQIKWWERDIEWIKKNAGDFVNIDEFLRKNRMTDY